MISQAITEFVSGYNDRDANRVRSVFSPADIYDPLLLVFGLDIRASSTDQWVEAGWSRNDSLAVAESCVVTGPTPGAEIVLGRMNDPLRGVGVTKIDVSYKLQTEGKVVTNFVGDRVHLGEADRNPFCSSFSQAFRDRGLEDLVPCS